VFVAFALAAASVLVYASPASAVSFTNACKNSVTTDSIQLGVEMTSTAPPNPVAPGSTITLSNINQTVSIPAFIFVRGYNLGLLTVGTNNMPADVKTVIDGTNTVEGQQTTNTASNSISTMIYDPDGMPGTGDETASDSSLSVTYNNETWTAAASGTIGYREHTDTAITGTSGGGIQIIVTLGGAVTVQFHCSPSTDPAPSFAATFIQPPPRSPRCAGRNATLFGTNRNDKIRGTGKKDVIAGLGGNDVLRGLAGNDVICGGPGNDRLVGGPGRDRLLGQGGRDTLLGGRGRDILRGGADRDREVQ
jgi:Ca2+-binding RTX toxin-like protein